MESNSSSRLQFFILVLVCIFGYSSASPAEDVNALLEFKKGIVDPNGSVLASWAASPNGVQSCPATWVGITCEPSSGAVVGLNLSDLGLSGELKFTTLTGLRYLQTLSLAGNGFTGRLVPVLGSMTSLSHVDLSGNQFYGSIPDRIGDLSGLVYLNVSFNNFTQGYPQSLSKLQNLRVLDLKSNGIWGEIGGLLSQLRNIEYVDLSANQFTGEITIDAANLTNLGNTVKYLNLSYNRIQGGFFSAPAVQSFKNLEVLDLGFNEMTGEIPSVASWFNLKVLKLGFNRFFGLLPQEIFQSSMHLVEIDLSGNAFTGSIPVINSTTLQIINLSSSSLTGQLPVSIGQTVSLDLSSNNLAGDLTLIPNWSGSLQTLDLSSNSLSGQIPQNAPNFQTLISLNLHNNSLTGSLPSDLGNYPKLSTLDLSFNKLTGQILPSLFTSLTLETLNLSNNDFTGPIPAQTSNSPESLVLPSYTHLTQLDLSSNSLTGEIPSQIGYMQNLSTLNLSQNKLSGQIPTELTKLTELNSFNVSYNDLSGTVPKDLERFPASSFFPGNPGLLFPDGVPKSGNSETGNPKSGNSNSRKMKPGVRVALIIGCVGSIMLLIFVAVALYIIRSQQLCGRTREVKLGRQPKDLSAPPTNNLPTHTRSMNQKEPSVPNTVELSTLNHVTVPIAELAPNGTENHVTFEIPDIQSPDRLSGELTLLDKSVIFTADELAKAPAEILGRSSHGTTYKAKLQTGQVLAVKWLRGGLLKNKREFNKEAKKVGGVRNGNLVKWRGFYWGSEEKERFVVKDFVEGESLAMYLYESTPRRYSRLTVTQRLKICLDLAHALHHLHSQNLSHGNLKPSNILLTGPSLSAKLTDFSLHRLLSPSGLSSHLLNLSALGYLAPELSEIGSKPIMTFKGDVYAFGVVLMEMLTRKGAGDIISGQSGAVDLTDWVQLCNREGRGPDCFDREISGLDENENSRVLDRLLEVSLRCISVVSERPDVKWVLEELERIAV
ncbi:hypothetical protein LUZ60_006717 [Juncus effusus]|nr:hypothetical protein LUZ60_006717 [Juncus effusus]